MRLSRRDFMSFSMKSLLALSSYGAFAKSNKFNIMGVVNMGNESYKKLESKFSKYHYLNSVMGLLGWDMRTIMPVGASKGRGEQIKVVEEMALSIIKNPEIAELIDNAKNGHLENWQKRNLHLMQRTYDNNAKIPNALQVKMTDAAVKCETKWVQARKENDFASFEPLQQEVLNLTKEIAQIGAESSGKTRYDYLLDHFEEGMSVALIDPIFKKLREFLPSFSDEVIASKGNHTKPLGKFSPKQQKDLSLEVMKTIGFDFDLGRLDETVHPFCATTGDDVRIATKFIPENFLTSLYGTIHETGHAMYEFQTPEKLKGQPIGEALGMVIHESQSLFMENQMGMSPEFIEFVHPIIKENLVGFDLSINELKQHVTQVKKSLIRIEADEVTYPLHVILRYEIEKELINGQMRIKDLPEIWNEKSKDLLGIVPQNYSEGCMQDIHWTDGSFGYFPDYLLGAIAASQFANKMHDDLKDVSLQISKGNFSAINKWLKVNVHEEGSSLKAQDLLTKVTGSNINVDIYLKYLRERYL